MMRAAAALVLLAASIASADDGSPPWFHETLSLRGGAIFALLDTAVEINGVEVDAESDLAFDDFEVLPSVELRWRFSRNRRHRLEIGYFSVLRDGDSRLETDLDLPVPGIPPIPAGADTDVFLDLHVATLTYGYSLLHDEQKELGLFFGLDFIVADAGVEATLSGTNIIIRNDDLLDENFNVPFPTAGAYFNWAFNDKWAAITRFQYFGLKFEGIEGVLLFPGTPLETHWMLEEDDPKQVAANLRAVNRCMAEQWGWSYRDRIHSVALLDLSNLEPGAWDIIVCTQAIHHFPPSMTARMFREAARSAGRGRRCNVPSGRETGFGACSPGSRFPRDCRRAARYPAARPGNRCRSSGETCRTGNGCRIR